MRHFRLVEAIAKAGSITKAASALGVSQPSLTAQLQRIERRTGGPLFRRDRTGSHPTALGEVVLAHAKAVLATASRTRPGVATRPLAGAPLCTRHLIVWSEEGPLTNMPDLLARAHRLLLA